MKEIWKPIEGYDGDYEASNIGRVKSIKSNKMLKPMKKRTGYYAVGLYKNAIRKYVSLHRVVAIAFIGNPPEGKDQINHIDGDKANNSVQNLEWCNQSENLAHSFNIGLRDYNMMRLIETNRRPVKQYDMNGEFIKEWYSMSEAARSLNISVSNICNCCKGLIKSVGGYKWEKV